MGDSEDHRLVRDVRHQVQDADARRVFPQRIGRYAVVGVLGRGGMGIVYRAIQDRTNRTVALKVIRTELLTERRLSRFVHEVEILGRLQHPGIAQILDADVVDCDGGSQPLFAMELIEGQRLTEYASSQDLGMRDRLSLLAEVCDAVQYAHQNGVIHRDLKPQNVLVDSNGHAKVLDFGVARVTAPLGDHTTQCTDPGELVGTLPYMSPEQVTGDASSLDTRSDIYTLGVLGCELLVDKLPYSLDSMSISGIVSTIRDTPPTLPGTHDRTMRGDVDAIIGKALDKDRERRYTSAADFAADIRRFLNNEPIQAALPSTSYRLRKLVRRNMALTVGILIGTAGLLAMTVGTSIGLLRAREAEAIALRDKHHSEEAMEFLIALMASCDPRGGNPEATVREMLDRAAERVLVDETIDPYIRAEMQCSVGRAYAGLGLYELAERHLRNAVRIGRSVFGEEDVETLAFENDLGMLLRDIGQYAEAEDLLRKTLDVRRRVSGETHINTIIAIGNLGLVFQNQGKLEQAEAMYREGIEIASRCGPDVDQERGTMCTNLASLLAVRGEFDEAERLRREAIAIQERILGAEHPDTLLSKNGLAILFYRMGRLEEAVALLTEVVSVQRRILGEDHNGVLTSRHNLAAFRQKSGELELAETEFLDVLEKRRAVLGPNHPDTLATMNGLGNVLADLGRWEEAEKMFREILSLYEMKADSRSWRMSVTRGSLGRCLMELGHYEASESLMVASHDGLVSELGDGHFRTRRVRELLVDLYQRWGFPERAAPYRDADPLQEE